MEKRDSTKEDVNGMEKTTSQNLSYSGVGLSVMVITNVEWRSLKYEQRSIRMVALDCASRFWASDRMMIACSLTSWKFNPLRQHRFSMASHTSAVACVARSGPNGSIISSKFLLFAVVAFVVVAVNC